MKINNQFSSQWTNIILLVSVWGICIEADLRYYATFKVRKVESLFYKINTCLQKTTTCIGLQAE